MLLTQWQTEQINADQRLLISSTLKEILLNILELLRLHLKRLGYHNHVFRLQLIRKRELFQEGFIGQKNDTITIPVNALCKPVERICLETGEVLETYFSAKEAQKTLGGSGHIAEVCKGKRKSAFGTGWRYAKVPVKDTKKEWDDWLSPTNFSSYKISKDGRIYSSFFDRLLDIKPRSGYMKLTIVSDDGIRTNTSIHQLMARTYIPNPKNRSVVNHIDENPLNNTLENLEWVTSKRNSQHSAWKQTAAHKKSGHKFSIVNKKTDRRVGKYDSEGNLLEEFKTVASAARSIGKVSTGISAVLAGKQTTSGGFWWQYL